MTADARCAQRSQPRPSLRLTRKGTQAPPPGVARDSTWACSGGDQPDARQALPGTPHVVRVSPCLSSPLLSFRPVSLPRPRCLLSLPALPRLICICRLLVYVSSLPFSARLSVSWSTVYRARVVSQTCVSPLACVFLTRGCLRCVRVCLRDRSEWGSLPTRWRVEPPSRNSWGCSPPAHVELSHPKKSSIGRERRGHACTFRELALVGRAPPRAVWVNAPKCFLSVCTPHQGSGSSEPSHGESATPPPAKRRSG